MKNLKKILCVVLAVAMLAVTFVACSKADDKNDGETTAANNQTAAVETVEAGVLTMATNAEFPPYEFKEGDKIVGIDAEVAEAIAEKLGLKLEIVDTEFNSIIPGVQGGKYDIGMAGMTVNDERLLSVDFSTPYAKGIQAVIVKEDSPIKSVDDLFADGATYVAGVQMATTGDIYATDDLGSDRVQEFDKGAAAVQALVSDKLDCVIIDNEPAKAFVEANEGLKVLETSYADEDYAICFSKENPELKEAVNKALEELIADGTVQKIVDKYIPAN